MNRARIEEIATALGDVLKKQEEVKVEKKNKTVLWVFAIIGAIAAAVAIAYAVYCYFTPDYLEDFEEDFDDDFDDDFFDDDDEEIEVVKAEKISEDAE
jgi:hypothetical protein